MKLTRENIHKLLDAELDKKGFGDEIIVDRWGTFSFGIKVDVNNGEVTSSMAYHNTTNTAALRILMQT
jgi:hypothetical protein